MQRSRRASIRDATWSKGWPRRVIFAAAVILYGGCCVGYLQTPTHSGQHTELPWYVTTAAIHRMMLKPFTKYWRFEHLSIEPGTAEEQLKELRTDGVTAIEIFAPEEGGNSYDGLDAKNRYLFDPGVGSMEDFRRLVRLAHSLGMHVITFQNLGYSSEQADQFLKAAEDERAGRNSREAEFFFWSDSADAPAPAISDSYFLIRPALPGYDPKKNEFWQWSERAHKFYWTRWPGFDIQGNPVHLPQYNWSGKEWPIEAKKVIQFWLGTGIDGMVLDAVNWYAGIDWQKNAKFLTGPLKGKFSQPEGGGAFHKDDPVGWITEGNYTNLFDYGLGIWWEPENHPLEKAVRDGNPELLEQALRNYHDRVVAAGGTLYFPVPNMKDPALQTLAEALIAGSGDMLCYCTPANGITRPATDIPKLLQLKSTHAALYQNSTRRRIPTNDDAHAYAILRAAAEGDVRLLLVFNFSSEPEEIRIDTGAIHATRYVDVHSSKEIYRERNGLAVKLPSHGFQIYEVY